MNYVIGTGNFGIIVKTFLEQNNIKISGFIELNPNSQLSSHDNIPIISIDNIRTIDNIYIGTNRFNHKWIQDNVCKNLWVKYPDEYLKPEVINKINFSNNLKWSKEKIEDEIRNYFMIRKFFNGNNLSETGSLILNSLDVVVTERCTLKCVNCSNLMQYYEKPNNSEEESLINNLDKILDTTFVNSLRFIGGEPLINRSLGKVIKRTCEKWSNKVKSVEIYTNGTILPSEELIKACLNNPVTFYISDYGDKSKKLDEVLKLLNNHKIRSAVESNLTWQDCGRVLPYDKNNIDFKYANCCVSKTFSLLNNYLYSCPFSANFHNLYEGEEKTNRDSIFIPDKSKSELLNLIRKIQVEDSPLSACYYCNGRDYSVGTVKVAEQTREILKRNK